MSDEIENGEPLDAFSAHEVLHTSSILASMFDDYIAGHKYTQSDRELATAARRLSERLHEFYQLVGTKAL